MAAETKPIQLHADLEVGQERDLLANFDKVFRPAIRKQPGFVDVRLLKLRQAVGGPGAGAFTHRLIISFETEEQRQKWVATAEHQRVWPAIEKTLKGAKFNALLYDPV
jgi:heme-degrading monooxygenase HmoA